MATAEQNMMLLQQLFGAPAQQFNQQNDAQTNLMLKLALVQREEKLKRDLATQQATREDARWTAQGTREDARATAAETRQTAALDARERSANTRLDAAEGKQLRALISKGYREYTLEAEEAGIEVQPRTDFSDDDEGLGALTQAFAKAKKANKRKEQQGIAKLAGAELTAAADEFKQAQTALQKLSQPNEDDNEQAKLFAMDSVQKAIQNAPKPPPPDAVKKGLEALRRDDTTEAKKFLGAEIFGAYESGFQQALRGLLNTPARRQQITETSRATQGIQARLKDMAHSYRVGAAQNPELAAEVTRVLTPLERMMQEQPKAPPSFDRNPLLNPPPSAGTTGTTPPARAIITPQQRSVGAAGIGAPPLNLIQMSGAPATSTAPPASDRAPYSVGQEIRNMLGLSPLTREGYAFDLQKLNDQLGYQNEQGRATTLQQLQRLLLRAQNDPALAPSN